MSPLTPTVHGADLQEVIRELFKITLSGNGFTREETTNTADNIISTQSIDSQGTNGISSATHTETETGDKKGTKNGNEPTTDTGDSSKTGGDPNRNPNSNETPTVASANKGNSGGGGGGGGNNKGGKNTKGGRR
jgi:hypothetical protein